MRMHFMMSTTAEKVLDERYGEISKVVQGVKHLLVEFDSGKSVLPRFFENYTQPILDVPFRENNGSFPRTGDAELDEILQRDFTSTFRKGYITVEGVTMPKRFEDLRENIRNLSVKEDDVWICSFPKTGRILFNAKPKRDRMKKSGIYRLECGECSAVYTGQTGRNFDVRFREHVGLDKKSTMYEHLQESKHKISKDNLKILHTCNKGKTMNLLEAMEINKSIKNPKFGTLDLWTTWTQEMVWMIMNNLDFVGGQVNLGQRSPFLEVSALFDYREFKKENVDFQPPPFLDDSLKFVKNQSEKGALCLKTHLPWVLLPEEIQDDTKHPKIIYVTRNPKDTCISYYNHSRLMEGYRGNFEDYCRLFLAGKLPFAPFWNHVLPFWERRNQPNILFLKYEEMIKDLPSIIRKVANFLEKSLSDEQVEVLSSHLSFESMKKNPAVNYEMVVGFNRKYNLIEFEGSFMRSGKVGDYKAKMSPEVIRKFDEWTKEHTKEADFFF